jgi:tetratricopeptide (TPR) repeat protein
MTDSARPTDDARAPARRRTLSVRVLVVSLVLVAVTVPSLYALRKWQLARTATAYLDRAAELEKKEEWLAAADYITRFLTLRPRDAEAEVRLAETFSKGADTPSRLNRAAALHYAALSHDLAARQWPLRQKLVDVLLKAGRFAEAETEARKILAHDPASLEAGKALAVALFGRIESGSFSSSTSAELKKLALLATIDQARRQQPKDVQLAVIHASLLRGHPELARAEQPQWKDTERQQNADRCLDELIAADPASSAAWLARFSYRQQFALPGADEDLAQALELAPQDPAVLAAAGATELKRARRRKAAGSPSEEVEASAAQAAAHFQALLAAQPPSQNPLHQVSLGESQLLRGKTEEAIATWQAGVKKFAGAELLFEAQLADTFLDLDRRKEAEQHLAQIDRRIDEARARLSGKQLAALTGAQDFRRARLAFQARDFATAIPQLQRVAARAQAATSAADDAVKALVMLGQCHAAQGQWREAGQAYDDACQRNPRLALVRLAAAQSWLTAGRYQLAAERAEDSLALADSTAAWLTLATAIYREQLGLAPAARNWDRFELTWAETRKRNEASPLAQPWQIELLQFDALLARQVAGATAPTPKPEQVLRDLEIRYPADAELWSRLSLAWQRLEIPAEADRSVAHLRSLPAGERMAAETQVRLHWARREHQQAEEIVASLAADVPAAQRGRLVREWINLKLARGDTDGARALLVKEQPLQPGDVATLQLLAELEIQSGRWAEAQKWEQQLSRLPHPADLHARVLRARRLLASSKFPGDAAFVEAENELKLLRDRAPAWGEVAALAGAVSQQRGDWDESAAQYSRAVTLGERRLTVFENLIAVLEKLGRLSEAQEYLQKLESQIPLSQALTELQGTVEMRLDQPERALAMARKAVQERPQDVQPRLWLARLLATYGQPDEAEAELKQALAMAPKDMGVLGALQLFYVRIQKPEAATQFAKQLQQQNDLPESERYFVAAQGFELAGKRDLAEESFRRAAEAAPRSAAIQYRLAEFYLQSDSRKAQACLEKTLQIDPAHRRARRMLAILLAARGSDDDWAQAQALLANQSPDQRDASGDARLHAALLARRGGKENLELAQKLLEQLIAQPSQSVLLDRLLLAQVYERQANSPVDKKTKAKKLELARRELEVVASRPHPDWSHFTAVIEFCDRQQDAPGRQNWLARFQRWINEQQQPTAEAVLQLVRLQLKHRESEGSGPWLDRLEAMQADPLSVLLLRAQWLSQQGRGAEMRLHVDSKGEELLGHQQTDEGKTRIVAGIAAIYRTLENVEDAERWERRLAAMNPQRYEGLAATLAMQGKWQEAVELCRRAAETDKSARPALVALACLSRTQITNQKVADCEPLIQTALHHNQDNADLNYAIGVVRVVQKRTDDAIASFRAVVKTNPRHVIALNNLGLLLSEQGNTKEALDMIDRAIDLAGLVPDLCDTKGTILLMAGNASEAIRFLELAASGTNVDPRYEFHLALALYEQGQLDRARQIFQQAIERKLEEQILTEWDVRKLSQLRRTFTASS